MIFTFKHWLIESHGKQLLTQSGVQLSYDDDAEERAREMLGRFNPDDLVGLVGAFSGCSVIVGSMGDNELMFVVNGPEDSFRANRRLVRNWRDGSLYLSNDDISAIRTARGQKLGAKLLSMQSATAHRLGVKVIKTFAQRGGDNYGYYSMPRMGYDAELPPDVKAKLPPELRDSQTLQDLMSTEKGRLWWRQNGMAMKMSFDPSSRSRSSQSLGNYLKPPQSGS